MLGWKVFGAGLYGPLCAAMVQDTATGVVAAGTGQSTATELAAADSEITTVASGAGVILSSQLAPGDVQTVFNAGANPVKVYPTVGLQINALPANAAMTLATNTGCLFKCISTTRVFGVLSA